MTAPSAQDAKSRSNGVAIEVCTRNLSLVDILFAIGHVKKSSSSYRFYMDLISAIACPVDIAVIARSSILSPFILLASGSSFTRAHISFLHFHTTTESISNFIPRSF